MARYVIEVKSNLQEKRTDNSELSFYTIRADIYEIDGGLKKNKIEENAVIMLPIGEPTNVNYEIGKFYQLDLVKGDGVWSLIKYMGEVTWLNEWVTPNA